MTPLDGRKIPASRAVFGQPPAASADRSSGAAGREPNPGGLLVSWVRFGTHLQFTARKS